MKIALVLLVSFAFSRGTSGQDVLLRPDRVFDGLETHNDWEVAINGQVITYAGPAGVVSPSTDTQVLDLPGQTLVPGLIEGHAHILLHPYSETSWNDQVLVESHAERAVRATNHALKTLTEGFTTIRDLGSEGAGYTDVGVKTAIEKGIIPGPKMLIAGPAIVATGSYGPKGFHSGVDVPLGAQSADGVDELVRAVREQIGRGVDVVKVYADYRWGPSGEAKPTFSEEELRLIVRTAALSGRPVAAHAATEEGIVNAVRAGVETIEHGDAATDSVFDLMIEHNVAFYPTLAAVEAIAMYGGWNKQSDPDPARIAARKRMFRRALERGVTIGMGGDVGVYPHGENAWELELMVEYGMTPLEAMRAATSVNAEIFHLVDRGRIRNGLLADLVVVAGDPTVRIEDVRSVRWVFKDGIAVRRPE